QGRLRNRSRAKSRLRKGKESITLRMAPQQSGDERAAHYFRRPGPGPVCREHPPGSFPQPENLVWGRRHHLSSRWKDLRAYAVDGRRIWLVLGGSDLADIFGALLRTSTESEWHQSNVPMACGQSCALPKGFEGRDSEPAREWNSNHQR